MLPRARVLIAVLTCGVLLAIVAVAWAAETLTVQAQFTPDKLGAPTNLSATAKFASSTGGVPSPIRTATAYGPAGLEVDVRGAGTCTTAKLEEVGPSVCPADSRMGYGAGVGLLELAKEIIREPFTLDFFVGPSENGHMVMLIYVSGVSPVSFQIVVVGKEAYGPKPYGWGLTMEIPPIPTLPDAPYAAVESMHFTLGGSNIAYYETVHGKRKLVHVRGVVVPKKCSPGGFPYEGLIGFEDGTTSTVKGDIACPRK
jgi:hypothetical protein